MSPILRLFAVVVALAFGSVNLAILNLVLVPAYLNASSPTGAVADRPTEAAPPRPPPPKVERGPWFVRFEHNRSAFTEASERSMELALANFRRAPGRLRIDGHTDALGEAEYNRALSLTRARLVSQWFAQHGVAVDRLETRGYGETQPLVEGATIEANQLNRRVEIRLEPR